MRAAMGCPAVPVVLGELGYFLDVADPRFVHAAAVNAGMVRLAAGDVASNPTPTPTPSPSPSPSPSQARQLVEAGERAAPLRDSKSLSKAVAPGSPSHFHSAVAKVLDCLSLVVKYKALSGEL